jgi:hypothetical protein
VPTVVPPIVKVTVPATVPTVEDCTVAISVSAPWSATVMGLTVNDVVVAAPPAAPTLIVVVALVEA